MNPHCQKIMKKSTWNQLKMNISQGNSQAKKREKEKKTQAHTKTKQEQELSPCCKLQKQA